MMLSRALLAFLLALVAVPTLAQEMESTAPYAYRQLDDARQEAAAQSLMQTLRCLQCQGQSIADSDAPIERYGDYVSYAPRVTALTWPLFALPLALIALAAFLLRHRFRRGAAA
jgi:cytochrome c-type biogenesis protein CcmH/NrfF